MAPTKKVQSRGARRTQHTQWTQRTSLPQLDKRQSVVSKAAYLLGVPTFIFEKDHEPPDWEIYQELEECRQARVIRNLCILRTELFKRYKILCTKAPPGNKKLFALADYAPEDCVSHLSQDGVNLLWTFYQPVECILEINRLIADQIAGCRDIFPLWIRWDYIENLFIVPDGLTAAGIQSAANMYLRNRPLYPYQVYMNWTPVNEGNILYSDMKFAVLLYRWNNDNFTDFNKVSSTDRQSKKDIHSFLEDSKKAVIVVDCENSDPYKLCAALRALERDTMDRISKIILYDDSHSASAWRILGSYVNCPVEHIMIDRVKKEKSLVDIRLTAGACKEFYQNAVDSFILVSSDSDYWGLISALPDARFLVMVERNHVSGSLKETMDSAGIAYCYLDDFCSGDCGDIKTGALVREMNAFLKNSVRITVRDMMEHASRAARVELSEVEWQQFHSKIVSQMQVVAGEDGTIGIQIQE